MKRIATNGIILGRINFGEADRILTVLTPDGKLRLMAKGVRRERSKMAGGIELLSVSNLTYIPGKGDMSTLISSRLVTHFGAIVSNLERTTFAYEALKTINEATEAECEPEFYVLLAATLQALDQPEINLPLISSWFYLRLLKLLGHEPNLDTTAAGKKLQAGQVYRFDFETMTFETDERGGFTDGDIKLMRLALTHEPNQLQSVHIDAAILDRVQQLVARLHMLNT